MHAAISRFIKLPPYSARDGAGGALITTLASGDFPSAFILRFKL